MQKPFFSIFMCALFFFSKGQSELESRFKTANSNMELRNMYQRIIWNMSPLNQYVFDQVKGEVKYLVEDNGYEVIAKTKILGTLNFDDNTFLWSDKNPSVYDNQSDKVAAFRNSLPEKYQKDKFKPKGDILGNLLSLFSYELNANAYDRQRQDNVLIFYTLLDITIFKDGEEIHKITPDSYSISVENPKYTNLIKAFHKEKLDINTKYKNKKLSFDDAFDDIENVHLNYWLNEDDYFFPSLCWPCNFDEKIVSDWKEFKIDDNRYFVMYKTFFADRYETYAYEIDLNAKGTKVIINEF
ncbi:hypothetical protein DFQ05_1087 [Winogradskyella wandonensis]|uniref:Uncharacterized protein n=1 Tax=Winogradskyella wandonensis TaxID=1442586 RepID=A0A4R1KRW0_9FLAO|nr:DUF6882 domain-containing protein [Winogradskyella wandonensis]TCK67313.1 hypothetical protein DFQ05_1087 [Winogradskyella wandonensis]